MYSSNTFLFLSDFMYLWYLQHDLQRDLTPPFVDDGMIEIVGFRDAWHGLVLLAPKGHGTRLAQVKPLFISLGSF